MRGSPTSRHHSTAPRKKFMEASQSVDRFEAMMQGGHGHDVSDILNAVSPNPTASTPRTRRLSVGSCSGPLNGGAARAHRTTKSTANNGSLGALGASSPAVDAASTGSTKKTRRMKKRRSSIATARARPAPPELMIAAEENADDFGAMQSPLPSPSAPNKSPAPNSSGFWACLGLPAGGKCC